MSEAQTIPAKYIYLDVVGFTHNRSVEAQTDIVKSLNRIVDASVEENDIEGDKLIYLPTGDGICICLLNVEVRYDIHIQLALSIIKKIHEDNELIEDEMRKFQVRVGINSNIDNLVTDINGNQNIAGAGINIASRIMGLAEGNQIFVSSSVYETLKDRERYLKCFKYHWKTVKHGLSFAVYQYIGENHPGLNVEFPTETSEAAPSVRKLPQLVAHYLAHAIRNKDLFLENIKNLYSYEGKILLWLLANESLKYSLATEIEKNYYKSQEREFDSVKARYEYYGKQDIELKQEVTKLIDNEIRPFSEYFEGYDDYIFVTSSGVEKLKEDWKGIYDRYVVKLARV